MAITQFKGEYRWLSNFQLVKIEFEGIEYISVEHAYMSAKSTDPEWKKYCSDPVNTPGAVKRASKGLKLPGDWDTRKIDVMLKCLCKKFSKEPFRTLLLNTGEEQLIEGNTWGDKFWGMDLRTNEGENNLGKLLMRIREEYKWADIRATYKKTFD